MFRVEPWSAAIMGSTGMNATPPAHVLVVDDNVDLADMFSMLLDAYGFTTSTAYSGFIALSMVSSRLPEIVICDIDMPGLTGLDVAQRIRTDKSVYRPLLIAVSGSGDPHAPAASMDAGFDAYFTKPILIDDVLALIGDRLRGMA